MPTDNRDDEAGAGGGSGEFDSSLPPPPPHREEPEALPPADPVPDDLYDPDRASPAASTSVPLRLVGRRTTAAPAAAPASPGAPLEAPAVRAMRARRAASFEESPLALHTRVAAAPATALISELVSAEEIALWHGLPRAGKSLLLVRALIDCALADSPVWDCPRFSVPAPLRVVYFTEEDGAGLLDHRLSALLAGRLVPRSLEDLSSSGFTVVVRRGITFDQEESQSAIRGILDRQKPDIVAFDPLRSFTANCDQGPALLYPVARFLRKLLNETSAQALIIGHHDVKPSRDGVDLRGRAHRASGGGIFSIADSPINFERQDDRAPIFGFPSLFKGRIATPEPFSVEVTNLPGSAAIRLVTASASESSPVDSEVLAYVAANPGCSTRDIRKGIKSRAESAGDRVTALVHSGAIIQRLGPRRAHLHYLPGSEPSAEPVDGSTLEQLPPE